MRIVVTGASGRLGAEVMDRLIGDRRHEVFGWSGTSGVNSGAGALRPVELTDERAVARALDEADPRVVIHLGALSSAEAVRRDPARGHAVNVEATRVLAEWSASHDRRLMYASTDLVFDGSRSWYGEDEPARPVLAYGRTKHEGESHVLAAPRGLAVRLSLLYGPSAAGRPGFFDIAIDALRRGERRAFFEDEFRTPLDYRTAAEVFALLVESEATGRLHVGGAERVSRFELMCRAAVILGIDPDLVRAERQAAAHLSEPRPADVSLDTSRLAGLFPSLQRPSIEAALSSMVM